MIENVEFDIFIGMVQTRQGSREGARLREWNGGVIAIMQQEEGGANPINELTGRKGRDILIDLIRRAAGQELISCLRLGRELSKFARRQWRTIGKGICDQRAVLGRKGLRDNICQLLPGRFLSKK